MFQRLNLFATFVALIFGLLISDVTNGQCSSTITSYSPAVYSNTPTQTYYSTPTYTAVPTQTYYSQPTNGYSTPYATSYGNQVSTPARTLSARPSIRFRDPYISYNQWYSGAPPTYGDYSYNRRFDGPNENYARAFNNANNLTYRNGILPGLRGGLNRSQAEQRDAVLRARAFTQARGLTWQDGPIRGYIGSAIRSAARQ